jgi:AcrR family transcriptional regulator
VNVLPKSYSDQEREYIIKRLKEEAAKCLAQYGIRRTTVDELVKRVNIPKGTFYLFYKSKELLLFEVIQEQHEAINNELAAALAEIADKPMSADIFTDLIYGFFKQTEDMPILRMLDTDEVELLIRKLPREVVEAHLKDDTDTIGQMLAYFPLRKDVDVKVISAAFHAIYFATLHKAEIGEDGYDEALRALIYGIVTQIM